VKYQQQSYKAFSLIEILIVLTIITVLTAITFPNFSRQIQSTRRTEAKTSLLDYALRFEEYYSINYTYIGAEIQLGLTTNPKTENGYYQLSAIINNNGNSYTLTAVAVSTQTSDTICTTMIINNIGQKTPTACW
jgi:type IV pilus assembly protein PilE